MSKFFINRPIVAMVISIVMVLVGSLTILTLPVAQFPNITPPEIQIIATYVGADAQTLEQARTTATTDVDRGLGARWMAMNDHTVASSGAMLLRLDWYVWINIAEICGPVTDCDQRSSAWASCIPSSTACAKNES